ncbi:Fatty acid synthase [Trachymyrmex septentrionalis]|uniref:Fatty acid synthase n=1 Tax=Trachymyrmex septentrionalis TaxID=34720 RepID=A0A195EY03_9HYME|nr:Fatty acid synthase [Trachymyrmex septentrionalis]
MSGKCEDAIIGIANLCLHPFINLQLIRLGILSPEGYCRSFDPAGNDYSRSEMVGVIYLQKTKNIKEAHGTGIKVSDLQEIISIYNILCKNREIPLMIGSVKSNHAESASAFSQIGKGSYRHLKLPQPKARPVLTAHVRQLVCADLSTLYWVENNRSVESRHEDLVNDVYSSLNFKDVLLTTGKIIFTQTLLKGRLDQYFPIGMEYVGSDANKQRVMEIREIEYIILNKITSVVAKDKDLCWKIPDTWTFEEAVTVPVVYNLNSLVEEKLIASVRCLAQKIYAMEVRTERPRTAGRIAPTGRVTPTVHQTGGGRRKAIPVPPPRVPTPMPIVNNNQQRNIQSALSARDIPGVKIESAWYLNLAAGHRNPSSEQADTCRASTINQINGQLVREPRHSDSTGARVYLPSQDLSSLLQPRHPTARRQFLSDVPSSRG